MEHCSKPLTAQSEALAEEANQVGRLSSTDGELHCECGERVSACRKPWMDGPKGGRWWPTPHYPKKYSRKPANLPVNGTTPNRTSLGRARRRVTPYRDSEIVGSLSLLYSCLPFALSSERSASRRRPLRSLRLGLVISSPFHHRPPVLRNEDRFPSKAGALHRAENPVRLRPAEAPAMSVGRNFAVEVADPFIRNRPKLCRWKSAAISFAPLSRRDFEVFDIRTHDEKGPATQGAADGAIRSQQCVVATGTIKLPKHWAVGGHEGCRRSSEEYGPVHGDVELGHIVR
jgi:hypothetical protein